ncbi:hypothetical protein HNR16_003519 [Pseudoclavibacter chungangensis]|nr:hypothetical protein [Pseudoclavibacter chungangensis]
MILHDDDPLAQPYDLLQFRGDEDDGGALLRELDDGLLDLGLGPDVDAARGLVEDEQLGTRREPAAEQHLLLIAAGEVADRSVGVGGPYPEFGHVGLHDPFLLGLRDGPCPAAPGLHGEDEVLAHREVADDALVAPVLGRVRDAVPEPGVGCREGHGPPVDVDRPGVCAIGSGEEPCEFGAARSEEPGDTEHLTAPDDEIGRLDAPLPCDAVRLEEHAPRLVVGELARLPIDRVEDRELLADHERDEGRPVEIRGRVFADERAVAEHRDAVADLVHLIEEV